MRQDGLVNDVIWYSRFAVLVGALVLLVQAVAGRAQGVITLIAILLLCLGFLVFVSALAMQGLSRPSSPAHAETALTGETDAPTPADSEPPGSNDAQEDKEA
jgi:disulfide bond formation protein DsbB